MKTLTTCTIPVVGMMCAACSANVERRLASLQGIQSVSVSLPGRSALIEYDPDVITLADMQREVAAIGYDLVIEPDRNSDDIEREAYLSLRRRTVCAWFFAVAVMAISMLWHPVGSALVRNLILIVLTAAGMFYCGGQFYRSAWTQLRHRSANMDTLVALSTSISFLFSVFNTFWGEQVWTSRGIENNVWFDASIMIITFVLTGRLLEERAKGSTASSIRALMGLAPKTARLVMDGEVSDVPVSTIRPRDLLEVRAGDKVPVDGVLRSGEGYVDESMISGEPLPVAKQKGDSVLAGTLVRQGTFVMRARSVGEQTVLSGIIRMVQQAQASKAPVQRVVDRVALVFVPVVVGISLLTFVLWLALGGVAQLPHALLSAVSVLVIACPCAMGLATPTALMVGIGKAAQKILQHGATHIRLQSFTREFGLGHNGTRYSPFQHLRVIGEGNHRAVNGSEIHCPVTQHGHHHDAVRLAGYNIEGAVLLGDDTAHDRRIGRREDCHVGVCYRLAFFINYFPFPIVLCQTRKR
ncbi:MAG: heavy metal translocating P-type ATPase [Bacteroidales bacterium]|nr:heavy metal translocating P-type ATPase [Bacteroidales bacterium]